jgi:predicted DsbA family dithiol-disulfide isomerase
VALTNAQKQQRWRERREELVRLAIVEDDTDRDIMHKIAAAVGMERLRNLTKAMPRLLAAEEKRCDLHEAQERPFPGAL